MNSPQNSAYKPRKPLWFFLCLAILGAGIAVFILLRALKPVPEQRDVAELIPQVQVQPLEYRESPLLVNGNGIVMPRASVAISPQVSGEIISLHPNLVSGGAFKAGEVLVQVDPRTYQANLDEAQANQEANLANLAFLEKQVKRITSLKESDYVGEESLDDATSRLAQTQAAIARQAAIIESRRLDLERTTIRAPFSGRVYEESVDVGDIVSPGMELASFYASDEVEIVVSLNANDAAFIPGLWNTDSNVSGKRKAWVTVDHGGRNYQWQGYVHRVESDIDRTTRTVDVVIRVPDPFTPGTPASDRHSPVPMEPPPLLVGMYAGVDIEGMRIDRHFELPISALRSDNTIWTVSGEGILNVVPVDVIREEGNQVALLAGDLPEGTPIIVSDIALVTDGMRVNVGQSPATEGAIL